MTLLNADDCRSTDDLKVIRSSCSFPATRRQNSLAAIWQKLFPSWAWKIHRNTRGRLQKRNNTFIHLLRANLVLHGKFNLFLKDIYTVYMYFGKSNQMKLMYFFQAVQTWNPCETGRGGFLSVLHVSMFTGCCLSSAGGDVVVWHFAASVVLL